MSKLKKALLIFSAVCFGLVSVISLILFIVDILSLAAFITLFAIGVVACVSIVGYILYLIKKLKNAAKPKAVETGILDPNTPAGMAGIYAILGIPLQYNPDGTIKDIYQLLGIEPEYDENGNRIDTIYELLGITPRFDQNGVEIPSVVTIKNRVKRFAKVDLNSRVLTRKLTEQEKEEILISETLKQKLKEAEQKGDKQQQQVIQKMIVQKEKEKEKKAKAPAPAVFKLGKYGGKSVGTGKVPIIKNDFIIPATASMLAALFLSGLDRHPNRNKGVEHTPFVNNFDKGNLTHVYRRPAPSKPTMPDLDPNKKYTFDLSGQFIEKMREMQSGSHEMGRE